MDDAVVSAMIKWPDVPAVAGWLSLTARGEWRLRGAAIGNATLREFIGRNYAGDSQGRWYFQNGPQRVYVELEATPWIYRLGPGGALVTHTGRAPAHGRGAALIDGGRLVLDTECGPGIVDDRDVAAVLRAVADNDGQALAPEAIERWLAGADEASLVPGRLGLTGPAVRIERLASAALAGHFGFDPRPRP